MRTQLDGALGARAAGWDSIGGVMRVMVATIAAVLALAGAAVAQVPQQADDSRWLPWLGCWEPVWSGEVTEARATGDEPIVCVRPQPDGAIKVFTIADGAVVSSEVLRADGGRHPVEVEGCSGWKSGTWSADGRRLFLHSELECEGMVRTSSGVRAILPGGEWLDVQEAVVEGDRVLSVRRFSPVADALVEAAGIEPVAPNRAGAIELARQIAAQKLSIPDVREAAGVVSAGALAALLIERGDEYAIDAVSLRTLADDGVPGEVTDVLVALSFPDRFQVGREVVEITEVEEAERYARRAPVYAWTDPFWRDSWYNPYSPYWNRYGYGFGYNYWWNGYPFYGGTPIVIVPGDGTDRVSGRAVKGRGYTRGSSSTATRTARPASKPDADRAPAPSTDRVHSPPSGSSTSKPAATPRGYTGDKSTSGGERRAKPSSQ